MQVNPITREKEPHVSFWKVRVPATFFSFSVVLLLTALALAAVFAVVLYRMASITSTSLFGKEVDSSSYKTFAIPSIAAAINLVSIQTYSNNIFTLILLLIFCFTFRCVF